MIIVATKLHIPRTRLVLVERPNLFRRLDEGMNHELTLITAPAGYGKTTLISEWAMTLQHTPAWVSLDQRDNVLIRFWGHTIAALKRSNSDFNDQAVLRHAAEDTTGDSLIAALINELHRLSQEQIIIWDDFHLIREQAILDSVVYLLERLPHHVHLYMTSRLLPALPIYKLQANQELIWLEARDLRFDSDETADFFEKSCGIQLSMQEAETVQKRTEGWATAMRLAVMSLDQQTDSKGLVQKMTGRNRSISNYFWEEAFSLQTEVIQQFLIQTSVLNRMTGELCQAVTEMVESEQYLHQLEQRSLFLIPLDEHQEWYRYHHLFQTFLIKQLKSREPLKWRKLHIVAGKWMEDNGYLDEAIEHYLAGEAYESALALLEVMAPQMIIKEWATLGTWLDTIPDALLLAKPMMLMTKLASQYLSGRIETATQGYWKAIQMLEQNKHTLSSEQRRILQAGLALLTAFRTFLDRDFEYVVEYSQEYLEKHPEGNLFVGFGNDQDGYHPVWDIYVSDSGLQLAEEIIVPLLAIWSKTADLHFTAHLHIDFGKLQYERNHLDEAEQHMKQAYEIGISYKNKSLTIIAELWLARITAVRGKWEVANDKLQLLKQQIVSETSPHLYKRIILFEVILARMQRDEVRVSQWVITSGIRDTDEIPPSMVEEYHLLANLLIERGQVDRADALINKIFRVNNRTDQKSNKIRQLISKSRILSIQGEIVQCMRTLEEALSLAYPENYVRTLIEEGAPLGKLLSQYIKLRHNQQFQSEKKIPLAYVKRLHRLIFPLENRRNKSNSIHGYFPSVTAKEQSVLRLIGEGLTNKEIADELNVSLSTIKTHINNIYSKLQVKNRVQALERARTYELF